MLKYILISFLIITNVYAYTCEEMGYTKSIADCPEGGLKCPAQPEKMFCCDPCGNTGAFKYNEENCSPEAGLQLAGTKCGGGWTECRQCTSEYKYNKDNCRSPKILAGVQCANSYTQCVYPSGIGCVPTVGYIYYADGSCHAEYDDTKNPVGVIVDAARKTIVALDEQIKIAWAVDASKNIDIPELKNCSKEQALLDIDGKDNTDIIIKYGNENTFEYPAAEYCANKTDGNRKWYLPSGVELNTLYSKISDIQTTLSIIPFAAPLRLENHWTSAENNFDRSYVFNFSNGNFANTLKQITLTARCFSHF